MADLPAATPVLVGVAACQQRRQDYREALEPVALMEQSLRDAAADAGSTALLTDADEIYVPRSLWGYSDPGRLVADALSASHATTLLADIGILQQTLLSRACTRIADGKASIVLVTGGEARYRELCAKKAGETVCDTAQEGVAPDLTLTPDAELWSEIEAAAGLGMPVGYYAILDSALRHQQGLSVDEHRDEMARCYAQMSDVAAANADAWSQDAVSAAHIREASPGNRMLAFPYTKLHNSQWNVDQAAGLILCRLDVAERLGVPREKWIFPLAAAESNAMSVVSSRAPLGESPGFRLTGERVLQHAGVTASQVQFRELYSCFPYAVRVQQHALGLAPDEPVSITGGMTFAGGPLNNFVLQATVRMAQCLREQPEAMGLITCVSGMLTKQACALWSGRPGASGFASADVSEQVAQASDPRELVAQYAGVAEVAGYTVLYQEQNPWRAVAVFTLPDGRRTVAFSEEGAMIEQFLSEECVGKIYQLHDGCFTSMAGE